MGKVHDGMNSACCRAAYLYGSTSSFLELVFTMLCTAVSSDLDNCAEVYASSGTQVKKTARVSQEK